MDECEDNPYEAPQVGDLPAVLPIQLKPTGLATFLLAGLYAALLMAPLIAVHWWNGHIVVLKIIAPKWNVPVYFFSWAAIWIAALGDGLTVLMCWKTVANRPRFVPLIAASVGGRILASLLQCAVIFNLRKNLPNVEYIAVVSLHYGVPPVVLTAVFLRISNRRVSFWVYPTIYLAASVAGPMLRRSVQMFVMFMFGRVGIAEFYFIQTASQSLFLCFLAAALWFGVNVSRPAATPSSSTP